MIGVDPRSLLVRQERGIDGTHLDRHQGEGLEGVELGAAKVVRRLGIDDAVAVLDADAKVAVLVVARLDRDRHVGSQRRGEVAATRRLAEANECRAFVHVEERAEAVSRAVAEVEAVLPERRARDDVELVARGAVREHGAGERNVALKHARVAAALVLARLAKVERARNVRRTVAGIEREST